MRSGLTRSWLPAPHWRKPKAFKLGPRLLAPRAPQPQSTPPAASECCSGPSSSIPVPCNMASRPLSACRPSGPSSVWTSSSSCSPSSDQTSSNPFLSTAPSCLQVRQGSLTCALTVECLYCTVITSDLTTSPYPNLFTHTITISCPDYCRSLLTSLAASTLASTPGSPLPGAKVSLLKRAFAHVTPSWISPKAPILL